MRRTIWIRDSQGGNFTAPIPDHVCVGCWICDRQQRIAKLWAENRRIEALNG